ncbi:leucine-rich repeat and coiled-coil domain-containing protein 1 [Aplysia californica]|uniref:Leucine-rich repeat and coiled-coil domain-containing protein 1 n=2 Tax=Aplysia californica TaxID=6500 RepID=A0ABM0JIL9_APLCA|nr:leucine-rich repeat and coiled-coil domain-containing protein 1 [Aplysia californica]
MQAKGQESESMKTSALEATCTLKQALLTEHEANLALKEQLRKMQEELGDVQESLQESRRAEGRSREALKAAEATMSGREAEEMADRVHQTKRLQEAQQRASAMSREAEVLRHAAESSKLKLQQLQETLATREQQHRQEMQNSYKLDSPELQKVISERVRAVERSHQAELVKQQERVEQLSRQYTELEEEFRYALHTEETRFQQLKAHLEQTSTELSEHKQLMVTAHRKDESSTQMVAELTALVKEQKGRIAELSKSKHEQLGGYKGRIRELEESLEDARKANSQVDSLKQAKSKLQATVQAQESVIEGLKAERKLWGQELAQQGASLSQDRGRLEAKIEALTSESTGLKKQLGRETDAVKIKAKMIEDQTETIRKLKEAVVEREETIKATREENVTVQRSLEDQVAELKTALDDTREVLDRSSARKEELKSQVTSLQEELTESRENHSMLSARWKEKSELIGRLEQQVTQMKNTWTQKEARVAAERDAALDQAKQALEKLKSVDSAFRQQLDVKEAAFQEALSRAQLEKQQEVELANRKVTMVEEEMRDLLRENEASKRAMETKVKKLTQALGDLQTDLL